MIVETDQKVESNANKAAELASEALRLAEEAKKASQRLAEVKAALSLMTPVSSPRAQPFVAPEKETREASPTVEIADKGQPPLSPSAVVAPSPAPLPEAVTGETAPETEYVYVYVEEGSEAPAPEGAPFDETPLTQKDNLFEKVLDSLGVDKLCGLDEKALEKARREWELNRQRTTMMMNKAAVKVESVVHGLRNSPEIEDLEEDPATVPEIFPAQSEASASVQLQILLDSPVGRRIQKDKLIHPVLASGDPFSGGVYEEEKDFVEFVQPCGCAALEDFENDDVVEHYQISEKEEEVGTEEEEAVAVEE